MNILNQKQVKSIVKTALLAGEIAMNYFGSNNLNIKIKDDDSPLTIADSLISDLIYQELKKIAPEIPIICEEGKNRGFGNGTFWLIDPIDGTSSFSTNDPEFTINIALIKNKTPVFGLIFAPAIKDLPIYYTNEKQILVKYFIDEKKEIIADIKKRNEKDLIVIASRRSSDEDIMEYFTNNFFKDDSSKNLTMMALRFQDNIKLNKIPNIYKVSSSLKFLYLIEAKTDLYLHLRRSMEWDIAAGHGLLLAAGGRILNLDGSKFEYEKAELKNKPFLASL